MEISKLVCLGKWWSGGDGGQGQGELERETPDTRSLISFVPLSSSPVCLPGATTVLELPECPHPKSAESDNRGLGTFHRSTDFAQCFISTFPSCPLHSSLCQASLLLPPPPVGFFPCGYKTNQPTKKTQNKLLLRSCCMAPAENKHQQTCLEDI